ncbi:hypothetical protein P43SY_011925 [Pythium insidiosum]|uniref:CCHC-type domain-containing protein n=1 Tax=Pythium insidiosum TaxID=114742 RepID=A0AAD5L7I9_PYTIN|nr:hypothetical protein P43SY_011925 [Pythium insidiosum]KAJ0395036.1 hypothetical protein ATCC90586_005061 [Pythium insidiosum]
MPPAITPAMAEQLAAINPALAAWVAALAQPNDGSQASRLQPEEEPADAGDARDANVQAMDAANAALLADKMNMSKKIETRTITVPPFDGSVPQGSFDAKAREFCEELNGQMEVAQVLAGQTWSDDAKKAVFKTHLTGMARRWYSGWCAENPAATYANSADALIWEFRPMLLGVDVAERIKKERKRWNETYREFADRLLQMADALEGGKALTANARHALIAFVRNAYPKFTDFLETKAEIDAEFPETQLKIAVSALSRKAETNGRMPERKRALHAQTPAPTSKPKTNKPQQQQQKKTSKPPPKENKKRPAEANAATVERKEKPKPSQNPTCKGQITCYECGATGHTADFCRTYLQGNKDGKFGNGAAQLAESNSVVDNIDMEDGE